MRTRIRTAGIAVLAVTFVGLLGLRAASSAGQPPVPTECASGVIVQTLPEADPQGVPVIVDSALSPVLYGDAVDLSDGVNKAEWTVLREVAKSLRFCLVKDPVQGDHYEVVVTQ